MAIRPAEDDGIAFGPFRLQPARRRLTRAGVPVRIGDRALDILMVLANHAPEIVSKNALIEQVWPDLHVEDSNLRFQMVELRKALGGEDYISTVQGRGYCLVVPVERPGGEPVAAGDAAAVPATNLPRYLTGIVGRSSELAKLRDCLVSHRLVTLVGPGGVGKTRLAVGLGHQVLHDFPGGVRLVDLAPLSDPNAVINATAVALRASFSTTEAGVGAIVSALGRQRSLLIFDNCEHLVAATATLIKSLLEQVPTLAVLATSQQALQLPAEQLFLVPPLAIPPDGAAEIGGFGAAELFVERAQAADMSFEPDQRSMTGIIEICRRLDGLPLALEMAAARLRMLGVDALCAALDHRLKLLKGTQHDGEARHGSLAAMIEWSQGLLDAAERRLFRNLAIFPGSFTLEAAVAVGNDGGTDRWALIDTLDRLVDKSLVTVENRAPQRYRLLETLRLHAGEMLRESGAWDEIAERHARHVAETLGRAYIEWQNAIEPEWNALYFPELDNLRAALDWSLSEPRRHPIALTIAGPGIHLLMWLRLIAEGRRYFERFLALVDRDTPPAIEAVLLTQASHLWGDTTSRTVSDHLHRAAELYRSLGNAPQLSMALAAIGLHLARLRRDGDALSLLEEAWELVVRSDQRRARLNVLMARGLVATTAGLHEGARACALQALPIAQALKSWIEGACLGNMALQEYSMGNLPAAVEWGRKAVGCARNIPGQPFIGGQMINLAAYLIAQDKPAEARVFAEEAISRIVKADFASVISLQVWAVLASSEGRLDGAARLIGYVDAERVSSSRPRATTEMRLYNLLCNRLETGLSPEDLQAYRREGAGWSYTEALEFLERALLPPPVPR